MTADLVLVGEPTGLDLLSTHLGWSVLELTVHGRETSTVTAPAGRQRRWSAPPPWSGASPDALPAGRRCRAYVRRFLPATPCYLSTVGVQGGNPFYPNVVPGQCTLTVDVRFVPGKRTAASSGEVRGAPRRARAGRIRPSASPPDSSTTSRSSRC